MPSNWVRLTMTGVGLVALVALVLPAAAPAQQNWQASIGAETMDMGKQVSAFLPNEIWIHAGDSITWTWKSDIIHTLTFFTPGQIFPIGGFGEGCNEAVPPPPPAAPPPPIYGTSPAVVDGSTCMSTPPMVKGQTFTVDFPVAGSFKFECMVHLYMTGIVHVLPSAATLPHDQDFYNDEGASQRQDLLNDIVEKSGKLGQEGETAGHKNNVIAGIGEVSSTPGGLQLHSLVRFVKGDITIKVGETVEWADHDPLEPHTVSFGYGNSDIPDEFDPSGNVTIDPDGALHATLTSPTEQVNSGFLEQPLLDEPGNPMNPIVNAQSLGTNIFNVALFNPLRFRATFTAPGVYKYKCFVHDNLGMEGTVTVVQ